MNFLRNLITEANNTTVCPFRCVMLGAGTIYHAAAGWMVFGQHAPVGMEMLGQYIQHMSIFGGTLAGGVGAKSLMKGDAP
jgi:hypothetical protein